MKVLQIINNLGSGGAEKLISDFVPVMNKSENLNVDILLLTDEGNIYSDQLNEMGISIHTISLRNLYSPLNIYHIRKYIVEGKYDIVHAHIFPTNYWVSLASMTILRNKPKFVLTEHSTYNKRRSIKYFRYIEKGIYSNYDKVICISEKTYENLIEWINPKTKFIEKYKVIQNGINLSRYNDSTPLKMKEINTLFDSNTKLVAMVGRFSAAKDQETVIKAMTYLEDNVHLLLVGEGSLKNYNKELSKSLGLKNRVHFLGYRNDVERILKTVDIIVMSSNWEGFGLAAVEGMASKKPVIATDIPGLRDIVNEGGLLFERKNSKDLSRLIRVLIDNSEYYDEICKSGLRKSKEYSLSNMINKYINIYNDIIN